MQNSNTKYQGYIKQKCAKTKSARNMINYTFRNSNMKDICKIYKNWICIQGILKMCKFFFNALMQKSMQNIFEKKCAICFLLFKAFQRALKSQNPMIESIGINIDLVG